MKQQSRNSARDNQRHERLTGETEKIPQQYSPREPTGKQYTALSPFQKIRCSTDELRKIAEDTILSPGPLTPNQRFEFKARRLRNTCHKRQLFSKKVPDFKQKVEEPRRQLILSLIHRIKPRLGGYSIWSASISRTIYQDQLRT